MRVDVTRLIERWAKGLEILKAMTPHEQSQHFNMALWGKQTDCGTVACAAGHFSLNPWFRRRGFCSKWRKSHPVYGLEKVPVLDPVNGLAWSHMINKFFYVDEAMAEDPEFYPADELDVLAYRAIQVFYDGGRTHAQVVANIEGTIKRLEEYRERMKKPKPSTAPAVV